MRNRLIILLALLFQITLLANNSFNNYQYHNRSMIHESSNIKISWFPSRNMFDESWWRGQVQAKVQRLKKRYLGMSMRALKTALAKYPAAVLRNNLKNIYLLSQLNFYGTDYSGTYYNKSIFIANKGTSLGYTQSHLEKTFHHEFSSILFLKHKHSFPIREWKEANASGFRYGSGGISAILKKQAGYEQKTVYLRIGILNQYAGSSIEEDINVFVEELFTNKNIFRLGRRYPRIGKKLRLLIRFYRSINPRFTRRYFLAL